jgi:hypothetical protein
MQQVKLEVEPQIETDQVPRAKLNARNGARCFRGPSIEVLQ